MADTFKATVPASSPMSVQQEYGFPADAAVIEANVGTRGGNSEDKTMMFIIYAGAPGALFNNAPLGAVLFDTSNYTTNLKVAAAGTGTWKTSAAMT